MVGKNNGTTNLPEVAASSSMAGGSGFPPLWPANSTVRNGGVAPPVTAKHGSRQEGVTPSRKRAAKHGQESPALQTMRIRKPLAIRKHGTLGKLRG